MTDRDVAIDPDTERWRDEEPETWEGYRLGDPIALADFLAFPERKNRDDLRFGRDDQGRLCLMAPDSPKNHRIPLARILRVLFKHVDERFWIVPEPGLHLTRFLHLRGHPIAPSRLGKQALEPDVVVFDHEPIEAPPSLRGRPSCTLDGLQVVVEVLSPSTFRNDLGLGASDNVDRWTSYRESGVPELWVINVGVERPCPIPPRSGLFLRNGGDRWEPLPVEDPRHVEGDVHGLRPLEGGRVRSVALGATFDIAALW